MTAPILYVRDGSRFVPLPDVLLRDVPPIPVPRTVPDGPSDDELPPGHHRDPDNPQHIVIDVQRCKHNSFLHWAARNCCKETYRAR